MQIQSKPQIVSALNENVDAFNRYIALLNKDEFETTPNGKWSAGQNLDHLIRAIKPLQLAYRLPKFFLKLSFGLTNRPSRSYEQLVEKYNYKLAEGGKASGPFIPPVILFENKSHLLKTYEKQKLNLIKKIQGQKENDLK